MNQVNDSPTEPSGASNIARVPEIDMVESREQNIQLDVWKTTQFLPKLEMSKLCEILLLPVCSFYALLYAYYYTHIDIHENIQDQNTPGSTSVTF